MSSSNSWLVCDLGDAAPVALERMSDYRTCTTGIGANATVDLTAVERGLWTHVAGMTRDGRLVRTAGDCPRNGERWSCGAPHPDAIGFSV